MELRTETELTQEIDRLRAEPARREREAADNERRLERHATGRFLTKPFSPLQLLCLVDRLGANAPA